MTTKRKEGRDGGRPLCLFSFILAVSVCLLLLLFPAFADDLNNSVGPSPHINTTRLPDTYMCIPSSCNSILTNPYCNSTSCSPVSVPYSYFLDDSAISGLTSCTGCRDGNETCLDDSCESAACVHKVCRPNAECSGTQYWDGDGFCDCHSGVTEPTDCCISGDGMCYPGCTGSGAEPAYDDDCASGSTCGNGICDFVSGDTCASCPFDCGECAPPQPPGGAEGTGGTGGAIGTPQHTTCDSNADCTHDNEICNLSYCPQGVCGWCTTCYWNYTKVCSGTRLILHDVSVCGGSDQLMGECQYGCNANTNSCYEAHCGNAVCDSGESCSTCPSDCWECPPLTEETQTANGNYTQGECDSLGFHVTVIDGVSFCVADESTQDPSVSISESSDVPADAQIAAGGDVYTYFILDGDFAASDLNVSFKVSKAWMEEHGVTSDAIVLSVYNPATGTWVDIPATLRSSDEDYYYFDATVPKSAVGLNDFAVTTTVSKIPVSICGNRVCESGEKCYNCPSDCGSCETEKYVRENPWLWAVLAAVIATVLVIPVWWFLIAKKKGGYKPR